MSRLLHTIGVWIAVFGIILGLFATFFDLALIPWVFLTALVVIVFLAGAELVGSYE